MELILRLKQYENGTWMSRLAGTDGAFYGPSAADAALMALQASGFDKLYGYLEVLKSKAEAAEANTALLQADYDGLYSVVQEVQGAIKKAVTAASQAESVDFTLMQAIFDLKAITDSWPPNKTSL